MRAAAASLSCRLTETQVYAMQKWCSGVSGTRLAADANVAANYCSSVEKESIGAFLKTSNFGSISLNCCAQC